MIAPKRLPALQAEAFERLLDVLLPHGGHAVMLVETYFDESGSHDTSPIICVAGYIIEKTEAVHLDREWRQVLASKQLPYFHMVDCAHGNGVFANLTKAERTHVESQMIGIIKRRTVQGVAATVVREEFNSILSNFPFYPDPYVMVAHMVLQGITGWITTNSAVVDRVAYFFEAGHKSQAHANALMEMLFTHPAVDGDYRYGSHAFVPKETAPGVQAADLLAWQWLKDRKNVADGRPRRKDCESLLGHHHNVAHMTPEIMEKLAVFREPLIAHFSHFLEKGRPS